MIEWLLARLLSAAPAVLLSAPAELVLRRWARMNVAGSSPATLPSPDPGSATGCSSTGRAGVSPRNPVRDTLPGPMSIAMTCGPAWNQHVDDVRLRSYELAVARGHVRRYA